MDGVQLKRGRLRVFHVVGDDVMPAGVRSELSFLPDAGKIMVWIRPPNPFQALT